jgi:hypothetical protein
MPIRPLFLALLFILTVFISCKKSDNQLQPEENKIPKIKTESWFSIGNSWGDVVISYEYDQDGRIAKITDGDDLSTYKYEPQKVIINKYNSKSQSTYVDTLLLNNKGLVIAERNFFFKDFIYKYNTEGYRITAPNYGAETWTIDTLTIKNGNTVEITPKYWNEYVMATTTYKFQASLNTIGDQNKGITWNGKQNVNLTSEEDRKTVNVWRTYEQHYSYTYEFDTKIRITKKIITYGSAVTNVEYSYY